MTVQNFYDLDRSGKFEKLGNLTGRFSKTRLISRKARSIRVRITDSGNVASRIESINIDHQPQRDRKDLAA